MSTTDVKLCENSATAVTAFNVDEPVVNATDIANIDFDEIPDGEQPAHLSYNDAKQRFIFEQSQIDIITFSEPLIPSVWNSMKIFMTKMSKDFEKTQFELKNMYTDKDTNLQTIEFYSKRPDQVLNVLLLWFAKTQEPDTNTVMFLFCRSSIVCSTIAVRHKLEELAKIAKESNELVQKAKEDGLSLSDVIDKIEKTKEINDKVIDLHLAEVEREKQETIQVKMQDDFNAFGNKPEITAPPTTPVIPVIADVGVECDTRHIVDTENSE